MLVICSNLYSQNWQQKTSVYNYGRAAAFACSANGKGYVGLGQVNGGSYVNEFWEYDTLQNLWTKKADFPGGARNGSSAFAVKGKIYICFGITNSAACTNDIWEYNPNNNT